MQCDQCTKGMGGIPIYIWKYEAQHHWARVHHCQVDCANIGKPDCPIPPEFEITVAEHRYLTDSPYRPELWGHNF